jgi:hypothetical protein
VDADGPDETGLEVSPSLILYAFELAAPHVKQNQRYADKLANQQDIALSLVDWALTECDRGLKLLELTSQMALTKRDDPPGSIIIGWPLP